MQTLHGARSDLELMCLVLRWWRVRAVAALVRDVCDPAWDGSLQVLRDDMSEVAVAWARVRPPDREILCNLR